MIYEVPISLLIPARHEAGLAFTCLTCCVPELPEVETVRRKLAPRVEGRVIEQISVLDPLWSAPQPTGHFEDLIAGRRVERFSRRGKYLVLELENERFLVMHLRMTGTLLYDPLPDTRYSRVEFNLDDGTRILFCDPRRFGTGLVIDGKLALAAYFSVRLGLEPFDDQFGPKYLAEQTEGRKVAIKSLLLDQKRIAGIGNIYADEALFRAGIHPESEAGRLSPDALSRLAPAIVDALTAGIDAGGATIDDFRDPDGAWGSYQSEFLVHRREGLPCPDCETPISKMKVGGRGTYWCKSCQKPLRTRRR